MTRKVLIIILLVLSIYLIIYFLNKEKEDNESKEQFDFLEKLRKKIIV